MTEVERDQVRAKASWEKISKWNVMESYPDVIPERLRGNHDA